MRGRTLRLPSQIAHREVERYEPHDLLYGDLLDALPQPLKDLAQRHRDNHDEAEEEDTAGVAEKRKQLDNLNPPPDVQPAVSHPLPSSVVTNLALSSLVLIQRSLDALHTSHTLASPVYAHCIGLLNGLSSHMTELERIRDTPIPLSVSRHFSRLLVIHTILLPVVVVQRLDGQRWWLCALIVGVVTSMLYGVDSFATRLGQPMGLDREDLPLERYVKQVQDEWIQMRSVGLAAD
ncbi:hypothetical protein PHBOTO_003213 [Pseudozyma hubeiensis]|nr:hypothetical protein PHBOTO_003213 [Pseudozyma hubeiensis]